MGTIEKWKFEDYPEDIHVKIRRDFEESAPEARKIISDHIKVEPTSERVLRCVLFLSEGRVPELRRYLDLAAFDYRDLIVAAEYKEPLRMERIRNFSEPFS